MSILTRRDPLVQTIDRRLPSLAPPVLRRPRQRVLPEARPRPRDATNGAGHVCGVALKKFEAENLLDWLEANGRCSKLDFVPGEGFTVWSQERKR
jgi:hypothetical protein